MTKVPGYIGVPIIGDRSIEFARNTFEFIDSNIDKFGRIFQGRLLNSQTIFIASHDGVNQLLNDRSGDYDMGYKTKSLWGENILFCKDGEAARIKDVFGKFMNPDVLHKMCKQTIHSVIDKLLGNLDEESSIPLYTQFKQLASHITISLFLGIDAASYDEIESISELTTEHWHGLISVPVNAVISGWSSTYGKALKAKENILDRIDELLARKDKTKFIEILSEAGFKSDEELKNHILLFVSALPPKAVASLLVSIFIELGKAMQYLQLVRDNDEALDAVITEVERLHPPFIGGRRQTIRTTTLNGFTIPKGCSILYLTHAAHRDPSAFEDPDEFQPERWLHNKGQVNNGNHACNNGSNGIHNRGCTKSVWSFGGGHRGCIGKSLMKMMVKETIRYLMTHYEWQFLCDLSNTEYKTLPVYRPKEEINAKFIRRTILN